MTAELAITIPAVLVLVATCLGMIQLASQQVRYADAAAVGARSLARGETIDVATERALLVAGPSEFAASTQGEFVCATVSGRGVPVLTTLLGVQLSSSTCALAGGL